MWSRPRTSKYRHSAAAFLRTAGVLLIALMAASCSKVIRQPEINLTGVKLGGIGLRGGTLVAQLQVRNPNSFDIETRQITYDLKIAAPDSTNTPQWLDFASGTFTEPIKIEDGGTTTVEVPIEFSFSTVGGALRSILDRGTFNYRVEGTVALREPLSRTVPYRHTGNVSLQGVR